jgi:hypothetical protein
MSLNPEISTRADQLDHAALRLIAARPDIFARRGHVAASYRLRNAQKFGPYFRLAYRDGGRQCSIYLGRGGPLVQRVRQSLDALQRPRREYLAIRRHQRQIRSLLRVETRRVAALLRPFGLRLKGFELRGIRFLRLRRFVPRFRSLRPLRFSPKANHDPPAVRLERFLAARKRLQGW